MAALADKLSALLNGEGTIALTEKELATLHELAELSGKIEILERFAGSETPAMPELSECHKRFKDLIFRSGLFELFDNERVSLFLGLIFKR